MLAVANEVELGGRPYAANEIRKCALHREKMLDTIDAILYLTCDERITQLCEDAMSTTMTDDCLNNQLGD
jgi:hypothetical protein